MRISPFFLLHNNVYNIAEREDFFMNNRKVAIIGCGFVGSATAFALMQSGLFSEMVLLDVDRKKAEGEAMDISHGMPFLTPMKIYDGDYDDIADSAVIIITAGCNQKPDEYHVDTERIYQEVKDSAYKIIEGKRATYYGVAMAVKRICQCIMRNERSILTVSGIVEGQYGAYDMALSLPAVVGNQGVEKSIRIDLDEDEESRLQESIQVLGDVIKGCDI